MTEEQENDSSEKRDIEMLKSHAVQLAEHFDSVQIITTRYDGESGQTKQRSFGAGNWYARFGSAKEWVTHKDEQMREEVRNDGE